VSVTVLIVDDEENARKNIGAFLKKKGYEIAEVGTLAGAKK